MCLKYRKMDFQSNPQGEYGRFEQILAQFVLKCLHIILNLRVPSVRPYGGMEEVRRSDRWFNLVLGDRPAVLDNLNLLHRNLVEPVIIDIILVQDKACISSEDKSSKASSGAYTETVIERWVVQCENRRSMVPHMGDSSFNKTYKKSIILLRSLYSMLKLLPAFKAFRKLSLSSQSCYFDINFKVSSFSEPFSRAEEEMMKQFTFTTVDAQQGRLSLSVTYRENLVDFILETSASFPPEIITDYVGSPLTDRMRSFPLTSMDKGVPHTSFPFRRTQSSSSTPVQRPQSWTSGLFRAPSLPQPYVGSPPLSDLNRHYLPPMSSRFPKYDSSSDESHSGTRSSREIDFLRAPESDIGTNNPGEKDDSEFSYNVDTFDSRARENLGSRKGSEASSQVCAKSQNAAVGALIHMLTNAPPLRQDSNCCTTIKAEVEGETDSTSQLYVPRKASDALKELKAYTQLKDMLLPKSTTCSGSEGGNLA